MNDTMMKRRSCLFYIITFFRVYSSVYLLICRCVELVACFSGVLRRWNPSLVPHARDGNGMGFGVSAEFRLNERTDRKRSVSRSAVTAATCGLARKKLPTINIDCITCLGTAFGTRIARTDIEMYFNVLRLLRKIRSRVPNAVFQS